MLDSVSRMCSALDRVPESRRDAEDLVEEEEAEGDADENPQNKESNPPHYHLLAFSVYSLLIMFDSLDGCCLAFSLSDSRQLLLVSLVNTSACV